MLLLCMSNASKLAPMITCNRNLRVPRSESSVSVKNQRDEFMRNASLLPDNNEPPSKQPKMPSCGFSN